MNMLRKFKSVFLISLVFIGACYSGGITPVDIEDGDMCAYCRMAISDKRFAAEIIDTDEAVHKFDDIGCMLRFRSASGEKGNEAGVFVVDNQTKQWLRAQDAFFVRSSIKTPMSSGIVAFSTAAKAGTGALSLSQLQEK